MQSLKNSMTIIIANFFVPCARNNSELFLAQGTRIYTKVHKSSAKNSILIEKASGFINP